ncbi:MAG TPA: imidazole glycerol phosphate synthase subunit HisH [Candidatus Ozemobacteraceae bacterium]|nr:imidazole glycerol phosphate synthase subunit HisH [Candidatus Ozemobacteraceae bacterium]
MKILIIDYGLGNLASVKRAVEECHGDPLISADPADIAQASHLILPGVGSFADGMKLLRERGWCGPLRQAVSRERIPLLGICLGMQLLADWGDEGGGCDGLGLIPGRVERLAATAADERIPHVGWNEVCLVHPCSLFEGIADGTDFYFVHSYAMRPKDDSVIIGTTPYAGGFASAVQSGCVSGVQFHPEKSVPAGFALLRNFISTL